MVQNALQPQQTHAVAPRAEPTQRVWFTPRVDILETDEELTLFVDLPGVRPEDADVRFENGELALHGRCGPRAHAGDFTRQEYEVGDFYRAFAIGEDIDADRIAAELKHGVLTVHLPKREAARPRKITVRAADQG
jgi:HSP20 family protein